VALPLLVMKPAEKYREAHRRASYAYYLRNRDRVNRESTARSKAAYVPRPKRKTLRELSPEQYRQHIRKRNKRRRARQKLDPRWRFERAVRTRLRKTLRDAKRMHRTFDLVGCTIGELRGHIERQFSSGMTWDNHGSAPGKWELDHRIPVASFDLSDAVQLRACFHYSNLQPLWYEVNRRKRHYRAPEFGNN